MGDLRDIATQALFASETFRIALALFACVCALCCWLLVTRRYLILLLWPVLIYFCGPALTDVFVAAPALGQFIDQNTLVAETVVMFLYFFGLVAMDLIFDLSAVIQSSIHSRTVSQLARSPVFFLIYLGTALVAIVLQINVLREYGSILSGSYAYWASLGDPSAWYWGFLAGLYEMVFLCLVLLLLSDVRGRMRGFYIAIYCGTALLRVLGGTRLILVKELAFILILLYLERKIRWRQLVTTAGLIIIMGSAIGLMRGGGTAAGFLGPLYGVAMESGLNALSFDIAYQVQAAGAINVVDQAFQALQFTALSAVPSFLRFGVTPEQLQGLTPYFVASGLGFNTVSPVGGMSGFATLIYVVGNPFLGVVLLVAALATLIRWTPHSRLKELLMLVFAINAIHFWRDGLDISVKNLLQDLLCALLFMYVPVIRVRSALSHHHPGPQLGAETR